MLLRSVAAGLLGVAALTSVAFAEPPASLSESSLQGNWRASKVVGLRVYNDNNENVGSINDLIMDKSGNLKASCGHQRRRLPRRRFAPGRRSLREGQILERSCRLYRSLECAECRQPADAIDNHDGVGGDRQELVDGEHFQAESLVSGSRGPQRDQG